MNPRFLIASLLSLLLAAATVHGQDLPPGFQLPPGVTVPPGVDVNKLLREYQAAAPAPAPAPATTEAEKTPPAPPPEETPSTAQQQLTEEATPSALPPTTAAAVKGIPLRDVLAGIKADSAPPPDEELPLFGFNLFEGTSPFQPIQGGAVPDDYVLGPGDSLAVTLWGRLDASYTLTLDNEGRVLFPKVGPVQLGGLSYAKARQRLIATAESITGVSAAVTMGSTRTIQVFVVGEARHPGTHTLAPFSTIIHAVLTAGGPTRLGSLRTVQLRRGGKLAATLDLYGFILRGEAVGDRPLNSGDVVVIPSAASKVWLYGKVKRPAIYELRPGEGLRTLLQYAGGLQPDAYGGRIQVERAERNRTRVVLDVALHELTGDFALTDGDTVRVFPLKPEIENRVGLFGHVFRPETYAFTPGMRVADLIPSLDTLKPEAELSYAVILREEGPDRVKTTVPFHLGKALDGSDPAANLALRPKDEVYVFSRYQFRPPLQATAAGEVRTPGTYRVERGARIADLLRLAGGVTTEALLARAELVRTHPETKELSFLRFSPGQALSGDADENLPLQNLDRVVVYSARELVIEQSATIRGEVKKPDTYPLGQGMRIADLVLKAGGLGRDAHQGEAHLFRTDPVSKEVTILVFHLGKALNGDPQENLFLQDQDRVSIHSAFEYAPRQRVLISGFVNQPGEYAYASNLRVRDLVLAAAGLKEEAYLGEAEVVRSTVVSGEIAEVETIRFSLADAMAGNPAANLALQPYDKLFVKKIPEWRETAKVTLEGEVPFPGTYYIAKGETLSSVLERAGWFTSEAYLHGAVFTRESARLQQQQRIDELRDRLQQAILRASAREVQGALSEEDVAAQKQYLAAQETLVQKLAAARATGRVVVNLLPKEQLAGSTWDVVLEDGDTLQIPPTPQTVAVVGQVYNPTSLLWDPANRSAGHYLQRTGGPTTDAEKGDLYVVRADGTVVSEGSLEAETWWSKGVRNVELYPGDSVLVPEKVVRINFMREVRDITQILWQIAVTAGVVIAII